MNSALRWESMADAGHTPSGETTLPSLDTGAETAPVAAKVCARDSGGGEALPIRPSPVRQPRPRRPRRPLAWWLGRMLPFAGLALFFGCSFLLLDSLTQPTGQAGSPPREAGDSPSIPGSPEVVIDPGHGGLDTGAVALGLQEKSLNLDVALRVRRFLEARGVPVRMTRYADQTMSLEDRVRIANGLPDAIFVSIHFNDALSGEGGQSYRASGVETYYSERKETGAAGDWMWTSLFGGHKSPPTEAQRDATAASSVRAGELLADSIQGSLVLATSAADRGTKERGLYVTRRVRGPAVLVEGGFISHPTEARRLGEPAYREKLAEAIADGIIKYLQASGRQPAPGQGNAPPSGA